jgi:anti-sigma B factor antagonist
MLTLENAPDGAVAIAGRFDAAQCASAQSFLDATAGRVTLDCAKLEYISSAGLGVLLKTQKRLAASSGGLHLTRLSPHIRDIFKYSGFDLVFEIEPE